MEHCEMKMPGTLIRDKLRKDFPEEDFSGVNLMMQFGMISRKMFTSMEKYFSDLNLTKGKFHVLMILYGKSNRENVALSDLSNDLEVTKSTITGLIDGLEKLNYVERYIKKGEDRRKIFIKITAAGDDFIRNFFPGHVKMISELISDFSSEDKQMLGILLQKINNNLNSIESVNKKDKE